MSVVWNYPTRIRFGVGAIREVGREVSALALDRLLIVTDPGVRAAGCLDLLLETLAASKVATEVFEDVEPNPSEENVERAARAFERSGAVGVLGIGGGSSLDCAKLIAVRSRVQVPFEELDDARGGERLIPPDLPKIVAIPTTAGTGSEVGRSGVVTVRRTRRKTVIFAPQLLPKLAILDPELTVSLPPTATAATGFDALTHCLEALVATGDHPMADAIAFGGLELAFSALVTAVERPSDLKARGDMLKASMMGAVAFQKGLGACHSLAHPLSSEFGMHHGLANAVCLPAVVEFNLDAAAEPLQRVAALLGIDRQALPGALRELRARLGLASRLSQLGVRRESIEPLAQMAFEDLCHQSNPRPCSREDLHQLYLQSL